jgi:predicted MFS family arabinose efflux permease
MRMSSQAVAGPNDGVGCLGGILAGDSVTRLSVIFGWRGAFLALTVVTALCSSCRLFVSSSARNAKRERISDDRH